MEPSLYFFWLVHFSDNPDLLYDITYFKRDTRRTQKKLYTYVAPALRQIADERAKARMRRRVSFFFVGVDVPPHVL